MSPWIGYLNLSLDKDTSHSRPKNWVSSNFSLSKLSYQLEDMLLSWKIFVNHKKLWVLDWKIAWSYKVSRVLNFFSALFCDSHKCMPIIVPYMVWFTLGTVLCMLDGEFFLFYFADKWGSGNRRLLCEKMMWSS